jgi:hypothetical protein
MAIDNHEKPVATLLVAETHDKSDKPLGALFSDLTREIGDLVRQEIALGRAEISEKMSTIQPAIISVAIGGAVALAGLFLILLAVVGAVAVLLPPELAPWLAPLIVGAIVALIGYMMIKSGTSKLQLKNMVPHRTVDSLMRDKNVVKETMQ